MALNITIPETIVLATRQTDKEFETEAKKAIALKLYADEKLSLGQAAELAGLNKVEFMQYLGENHISIFRFEQDNDISALNNDIETATRYANDK